MSGAKYAPESSWQDVQNYIEQHTKETKHTAVVSIHTYAGAKLHPHIEVALFPIGESSLSAATVRIRHEWPSKAAARQMRAILYAVATAYEELARNPWLWTPERRAEARGERG